jgi:hypothetical protein
MEQRSGREARSQFPLLNLSPRSSRGEKPQRFEQVLLPFFFGAGAPAPAPNALTIYNQNFAVVRDTVASISSPASTKSACRRDSASRPDSVILRDPAGNHALRILEQNYRNDPVSQ